MQAAAVIALSLLVFRGGSNLAIGLLVGPTIEINLMRADLEKLRQELPDPFRYTEDLKHFFMLPKVQELTRNGRRSAEALMLFISHCTEPALVHVAVLVLSQLDPDHFYAELLSLVKTANRETVEAMEQGLWRVSVDPEVLANDLIAMVTSEQPLPLLLLQRPVVRTVKSQLISLIKEDIHPVSTYAMYCLRYTLDKGDHALLVNLEKDSHIPQVRDVAREYLSEIANGRL